MKFISYLSFFMLILYLVSCEPSQKVTSSWVNKDADLSKKYHKIFIAVLTQNQAAKGTIEKDLSDAAKARGYQTLESSELFPPVYTKETMPSKDQILEKVKTLGCDAIFAVALADKQSETRYVPGSVNYSPYMGYGYGWGGYYNYWGPSTYSPGYYTTDKTYYMEANLFDVATEKLVWSGQSEAYNPTSLSKFSKEYAAVLADRMSKDLKRK